MTANGADFDQDLVNTIYAIVTRIFPAQSRPKKDQQVQDFVKEKSKPFKIETSQKEESKSPPSSKLDEIEKGEQSGDEMYDAEKHNKIKETLTK